MIPKRIFWGLCIVVIISSLWFLYLLQETPQSEKGGGTDTSAKTALSDTLIAKTTKLIIRQTINHIDFEKVKKAAIEKIKKKRESRYEKELDKIFDDIEYMNIKDTFGITRDSSQEEVIQVIGGIDRDILLKKLDKVPDKAIAKLIRKRLREHQLNSIAQFKAFLDKKISSLTKTASG